MKTPIISSMGVNHDKSNVNICATRVVLTSAPMITARLAAVPIIFLDAKDAHIIVVAVELCNMPVTPRPAAKAFRRLLVLFAMTRCRDVA